MYVESREFVKLFFFVSIVNKHLFFVNFTSIFFVSLMAILFTLWESNSNAVDYTDLVMVCFVTMYSRCTFFFFLK